MATPRWNEARQRWELDERVNGKRHVFTSIRPGRPGLSEVRRKRNAAVAGESDKATWRVKKCADEYLKYVKANTSTSNHDQREQYMRLYILPELEHKRINAVSVQDWQNLITFANPAKGNPLSRKSLNNLRATIIEFCKYAMRSNMIDDIPVLKVPRNAPKAKRTVLYVDQLKALLKDNTAWYSNAWRLQVVLGLRPGMILGIKQSDIQGNTLAIRRSINAWGEITDGKNENSNYDCFLHPLALEIIEDQKRKLKKAGVISPWLFPDRQRDVPWERNSYHQWTHWRKVHNTTATLYELRHTLVSITKSKMPEALLKIALNHSSSMDTLGTYGHEMPGEREEAGQMIWDILQSIMAQ